MDCKYCLKSLSDKDFIYETEKYKVFLAPEQSYLGRCVVATKKHVKSLSDLTAEEGNDFFEVVRRLEHAATQAFGAVMFNWTCMMNDAYQVSPRNPHVHWHFRPRYDQTITFEGETFTDPDFGHRYDRTRKQNVSDKVKQKIIEELKKHR